MLHFFLRHRSRCILVHSRGVRLAAEKYLSMLQARLSAPLQSLEAAGGNLTGANAMALQLSDAHSEWIRTEAMPDGTLAIPDLPAEQAARDFFAEDAESFLVNSFLAGHPASRQLFEELQASSNLPLDPGKVAGASPEAAWKAFLRQRWFASQLMQGLKSRASEAKQLEADLAERSQKCGQLLDQLLGAMQEADKARQEQGSIALEMDRLQMENRFIRDQLDKASQDREQLMEQLHQAQETLEGRFLDERLAQQHSSGGPGPLGAADRVKSQLSYRIGSLMVRRSKSLTGLLGLPAALWKEKRNFARERSQHQDKNLPPIHEYADAHLAEQVKKQLSYRLGRVVVRDSKSLLGWLRMPFSILWCIQSFHQQREPGRES
jgi:hypothetical protein